MAVENEILQLTKHTLELDKITILDNESSEKAEGQPQPSKVIGTYYPFIEINTYEFAYDSILFFELSNNAFLPKLNLTVVDTDGLFQARYFALDGAIVNFYIRANNEELYKPIHINFDILDISPSGISATGAPIFNISAQMKVPNLYTEYCEAYPEMSSYDALLEVATKLKLGFASNDDLTNDIMTWLNPYDTTLKFIEDITANSYKDDDSFFTTFIDPYYNLTFVNINKVLDNTILNESQIYSSQIQDLYKGADHEFQNLPLFYTNTKEFQNSSRYISAYRMSNNTGKIFLKNGYKRTFQYFDEIENKYVTDIEIDPLTGTQDGLIHLKGRYINGEAEGLNKEYIKYKFMGKQNENVHDYYLYSNVLNFQNNKEANKITMTINLYQTDMSIYRYQSVLIQIFEHDEMVKEIIKDNVEDPSKAITGEETPILNEFLSGMYVITGIDYIYRSPDQMYQKLYLNKREFKAPA